MTDPRRTLPSEWRPNRSARPSAACCRTRRCSFISPRMSSSILRWRALVTRATSGAQRSMNAFWLAASRSIRAFALGVGSFPARLFRRFGNRPAQRGDRVGKPLQMHFLPAEHLLIAVVRIVRRNRPRVGLPLLEQLERIPIELAEERSAARPGSRILLRFAGNTDASPRDGVQPGLGNRLAAVAADAIGALCGCARAPPRWPAESWRRSA